MRRVLYRETMFHQIQTDLYFQMHSPRLQKNSVLLQMLHQPLPLPAFQTDGKAHLHYTAKLDLNFLKHSPLVPLPPLSVDHILVAILSTLVEKDKPSLQTSRL